MVQWHSNTMTTFTCLHRGIPSFQLSTVYKFLYHQSEETLV